MTGRTREEILENELVGSTDDSLSLFSVRHGEITANVFLESEFPIRWRGRSYDITGRFARGDEHPELFKSLDHCIKYFQEIIKYLQEIKKIEEERSVWTLDKIHRAFRFGDKIEFSNGRVWYERCVYMGHHREGFEFVREVDVPGGEIDGYHCADWSKFKFRDWDGNLIDPSEHTV